VRQEPGGVRRYAHIGTGNYNRATSSVYTDFGLFTADPGILDDISDIFNSLTGYAHGQRQYRHLLVAPATLRPRIEALIEREAEHARAGAGTRIIIKCNAITDPSVIQTLYRASQAGVRIDLIVRGVCCLKPGVEGVSETITVRSIVGRFLEHSRAYYFLNGGDVELYIGSADLMERNLDRRVETLCVVRDPAIVRQVRNTIIEAYLHDTDRATLLEGDRYEPVPVEPGEPRVSAQNEMIRIYTAAAVSETLPRE
jgi:polyphosphate kinase